MRTHPKRMHATRVAGDIATGTQSTAAIGIAAPEAARSGQGWVPRVRCRCRRAVGSLALARRHCQCQWPHQFWPTSVR
jgi:hypothetical protein